MCSLSRRFQLAKKVCLVAEPGQPPPAHRPPPLSGRGRHLQRAAAAAAIRALARPALAWPASHAALAGGACSGRRWGATEPARAAGWRGGVGPHRPQRAAAWGRSNVGGASRVTLQQGAGRKVCWCCAAAVGSRVLGGRCPPHLPRARRQQSARRPGPPPLPQRSNVGGASRVIIYCTQPPPAEVTKLLCPHHEGAGSPHPIRVGGPDLWYQMVLVYTTVEQSLVSSAEVCLINKTQLQFLSGTFYTNPSNESPN
jgi:hypothetical protein